MGIMKTQRLLLFFLFCLLLCGFSFAAKPLSWKVPSQPGILTAEYYDVTIDRTVALIHNRPMSGGEKVQLDYVHDPNGATVTVTMDGEGAPQTIPWGEGSQRIINYMITFVPTEGEDSYAACQVNGDDVLDPTYDPYVVNPNLNPSLENPLSDPYLWHLSYPSAGVVNMKFKDDSTGQTWDLVRNFSVGAGMVAQVLYRPNAAGQHIEVTCGKESFTLDVQWNAQSQKTGVIETDYQPEGDNALRYLDFSTLSR
jgi:hypothetical protein